MKTVEQLLDEILLAVQPPRSVAVVLTEMPDEKPNWSAAIGKTSKDVTAKYLDTIIPLRRLDAIVDWSGITERVNFARRRIAK